MKNKLYTPLIGGLGNVMFTVCAGKYLAEKYGLEHCPEYESLMEITKKPTIFNTLLLDSWVMRDVHPKKYDYTKDTAIIYNELASIVYNKVVYEPDKEYYFSGYMQSPRYWDNDREYAKKLYAPPTDLIEKIKETYSDIDFEKTISIHIRRGDYLIDTHKEIFRSASIEFIFDAIKYFENTDYKFLVFSDDIDYCKENIKCDRFIFTDRKIECDYKDNEIDMFTMTLCRHNIISNSSFGWWGAYLNVHDDRKVIYNSPWFGSLFGMYRYSKDIIPENDNWIDLTEINKKEYE